MKPARWDLPQLLVEPVLRAALEEDLGRAGDVTSLALVPEDHWSSGEIVARGGGRVAGLLPALWTFQLIDPRVTWEVCAPDGTDAAEGATLAVVSGPTRALLGAERTALNFLGHLSGIATATATLARELEGTATRLADTRKTTPGLRALEKHAVALGGGSNHRFGLDDAVLIKDNHLVAVGSVGEAVRRARAAVGHLVKVEVEVETLEQLAEAVAAGADAVLLDNMDHVAMAAAVQQVAGRAVVEASGGITIGNVRAVAETGVDVISIGWLTHSAPALDVAFDLGEPRVRTHLQGGQSPEVHHQPPSVISP